jgi:hypothetical protein
MSFFVTSIIAMAHIAARAAKLQTKPNIQRMVDVALRRRLCQPVGSDGALF